MREAKAKGLVLQKCKHWTHEVTHWAKLRKVFRDQIRYLPLSDQLPHLYLNLSPIPAYIFCCNQCTVQGLRYHRISISNIFQSFLGSCVACMTGKMQPMRAHW